MATVCVNFRRVIYALDRNAMIRSSVRIRKAVDSSFQRRLESSTSLIFMDPSRRWDTYPLRKQLFPGGRPSGRALVAKKKPDIALAPGAVLLLQLDQMGHQRQPGHRVDIDGHIVVDLDQQFINSGPHMSL